MLLILFRRAAGGQQIVDHQKDACDMEICGIGYLSWLWSSDIVQSPHEGQSPGYCFGTMWRREAQLLDGYVVTSNMWSNSCCAIWRRFGNSCHALAETGGPVVVIWCVTLCLIDSLETFGSVGAGISEKELEEYCRSSDGLGNVTADAIPWMCSCDKASVALVHY